MASAWDGAPKPSTGAYVTLRDGEVFVGRFESVEFVTIPKGQMPNQPNDLTDVPRAVYTDKDGDTTRFDYTNTAAKNGILNLKPEPGTWVYHKREGRATGATYVSWDIREATGNEIPTLGSAQATPKASVPVSEAPPF
jgi:hypothetical protein